MRLLCPPSSFAIPIFAGVGIDMLPSIGAGAYALSFLVESITVIPDSSLL